MLLWLHRQGRLGGPHGDQPLAGLPVGVGVSWFLGASMPSLVAMLLTLREGSDALRDLIRGLVAWDVGVAWNLVALLLAPLIGLAAVAWHRLRGGTRVRFEARRLPLLAVALAAALPFGPLGEELGWRGYLLPRLSDTIGGLEAALLIGVIWAAWHIPLFWAPLGTRVSGTSISARAISEFTAEVTAMSVILTWLMFHTDGSLWIAVLFHAAWNADLHRFFFAPFSDELTERVTRYAGVAATFVAVVLVAWPGLAWR